MLVSAITQLIMEKNSESNTNTSKKRGGARPGSGRPKKSLRQPKFLDYVCRKDVDGFIRKAFRLADEGDSKILLYILDQTFGRAKQNIGVGGEDGGPLLIEVSEAIARKRSLK